MKKLVKSIYQRSFLSLRPRRAWQSDPKGRCEGEARGNRESSSGFLVKFIPPIKKWAGLGMTLCVICVLLSAVICVHAGGVGTTGAQFLKIGLGARPVAMGGVYAGIADDVNAIYWNPAGLAQVSGKEFTAQHIVWFQSINYEYIGYAHNLGNLGTAGVMVNYLYMDDLEGYDANENPTGNFKASDLAISLAGGRKINDKLSLGCNLKFISQTIDTEKASGFGIDLGGLYKVNDKLKLGLAVQNLGTKIKFVSEADPLPLNIKIGAGYKLNNLILGLDVNYPTDNKINFAVGAEYASKLGNISLPLRVGYNTKVTSDLGSLAGLGAGLGIGVNKFAFDFAWVPYGDLGQTYRLALKVKL